MFTNEFADLLLNLCAVLLASNLLHLISVIHVHRYKRAVVKTFFFKLTNVTVICDARHGIALKLVTNHIYKVIKLSNSAKHFSASS